jgi:hypothetical protein
VFLAVVRGLTTENIIFINHIFLCALLKDALSGAGLQAVVSGAKTESETIPVTGPGDP